MSYTTLDFDLKTMFLFLANATLSLDDTSKDRVFNDMAYKLMEWDNISRCEIRKVLKEFDVEFEELCSKCNEPLPDYEDNEEEPKCEECKK